MDTCNENSSVTITVDFTDENDSPTTPTSGYYRVDDLTTGENVVAPTSFTPTDTSYDIEIDYYHNYIINQMNQEEVRILTGDFAYGSGKHGTFEYRFSVKNLYGLARVLMVDMSEGITASGSPGEGIS